MRGLATAPAEQLQRRPVRGAVVNDGEAMTSDTPDSQVAIYDYEDFTVTWELGASR